VPFTSVDFGNAYLGSATESTLVVDNPGTDYVSVTVSPGSGDFSVEPETFSIPPQGTQSITLRFLPSVLGPVSGELKFISNDPARPETPVMLAGSSSPPPDLTLEPTSFDAALRSGETTEKVLTLKNIGGSECRWTTAAVLAPAIATFTLHLPTGPVLDLLGEGPRPTPQSQRTVPIQAELADLSGKRILWDARHGQGYPYSWSTLIADLTSRHAVVDVSTSEITLPFLRQYDALWTIDSFQSWPSSEIAALQQWVREGGALLIESDQATAIYNQILSGLDVGFAYVNVSANFGLTHNIYVHEVTNNVSEVYLDNPLAQLTRAVAPGRSLIDDNQQHPHAALAHAGMGRVIVVTDEDFYDGVIAQGDNQLFGNQAFDWLLGGGAVEIVPPSGTLPPLGAAEVLVRLRAGSLSAGIHNAALHILSNDPASPDQEVGIRMNITGAPHLEVVAVLDFGARFTGAEIETTLHVSNTGVLPLQVTSGDGWTPPFLVEFKPVTLAPFGGVDMPVRFAPGTPGHYESQIVLVSNDPGTPARTVLLRGDALLAPDVTATPETFSLDIVSGANAVRYLDLGNVGGEPLEWFADVVTDSTPDLMHVVLAPHTGPLAPPPNESLPVIEAAPRTEPV
ncbi:MAG TPA: choice-of-anchor D domain-containing protein, partial [Candidatus Eisenbacteria bacterium]|nr:choice-of-anchor D domain-containing protein [Candidatus Eisenbacteria bacterium]